MSKIKGSEIKDLRLQYYQEQLGLCALCREPIEPAEAVLDHDHKSGHLRGVLHRGCNAYIGSMENNLARNKISTGRLYMILQNFMAYVITHKPIRHPTHYTPEERAIKTKKRLARRRQQLKNQRSK